MHYNRNVTVDSLKDTELPLMVRATLQDNLSLSVLRVTKENLFAVIHSAKEYG